MDIRKELLTITACLSHHNNGKPRERNENEYKFTSEKLQCILKSYRIISTFYIESNLHKLLCKPKDRVATEDKKKKSYTKLTVVTSKQSTW